MKWPFRGKQRSGAFQLLPPGQPVQINHFIEVEGEGNARLIAEQLTGSFSTSWGLSPTDNGIGPTRYQVQASHRHIPIAGKGGQATAKMVLARGQQIIRDVIGQVPGARYAGWDRMDLPPAEPPRHHQDDDGDDSDSPMGLPLPIFPRD
jgi:hypothetical protein